MTTSQRRICRRGTSLGEEIASVHEKCFFCELSAGTDGHTGVVLRSAEGRKGVAYRWNKKQLPYFTLWKNNQCASDGYAVGLEPGTNFPYTKSKEKEQGRVVALAPGESRAFELTLEYLDNADTVKEAERRVRELNG